MKVSNTIEAARLNKEMKEIIKTVSEFKKTLDHFKTEDKGKPTAEQPRKLKLSLGQKSECSQSEESLRVNHETLESKKNTI